MDNIIQKRRLDFNQQCAKYLRYVFNDHFVLVIMFLIGFLIVQYTQLIHHFPKTSMWPVLVALIVSLSLTFWGKVATYMEAADQVFLLPQETFWQDNLRKAKRRTFVLWGSIQLLITVLLGPVFFLSGWQMWQFIAYLVVLIILRALWLNHQCKVFYQGDLVDFGRLVAYERHRQQRILAFFSLFTTVKGISVTTKPRVYLNPLLSLLTKGTRDSLWLALFARAYLRNGDYFWLSVRLLVISLGLGLTLPNAWGVLMVGLFNYLLLFQLLGLYHVYDYQVMTRLYPCEDANKRADFKVLLNRIIIGVMIVQLSLTLLNWQFLMLIFFTLILTGSYIPYKLKKFVD